MGRGLGGGREDELCVGVLICCSDLKLRYNVIRFDWILLLVFLV